MSGTRNDQPDMGTPAYFVTMANTIIQAYHTGSQAASPRRRALVDSTPPRNLRITVEGKSIVVTVEGKKAASPEGQRQYISYWNRRLIAETVVDRIEGIKWELRNYLLGVIEEHLIFRELGDEQDEGYQDTDGRWNAKGVGDDEET